MRESCSSGPHARDRRFGKRRTTVSAVGQSERGWPSRPGVRAHHVRVHPRPPGTRLALCGRGRHLWSSLVESHGRPRPPPRAPVPHMQFARGDHHTLGGTSAGKALHLHRPRQIDPSVHRCRDRRPSRSHHPCTDIGRRGRRGGQGRGTQREAPQPHGAGRREGFAVPLDSEARREPHPAGPARRSRISLRDRPGPVRTDTSARRSNWCASQVPIWTDVHDFDGSSSVPPAVPRSGLARLHERRQDALAHAVPAHRHRARCPERRVHTGREGGDSGGQSTRCPSRRRGAGLPHCRYERGG